MGGLKYKEISRFKRLISDIEELIKRGEELKGTLAELERDIGLLDEEAALKAISDREQDMLANPDKYFEPDDPRRAW